jgi:glycosyltransferase involved in cell wall biosynthesis
MIHLGQDIPSPSAGPIRVAWVAGRNTLLRYGRTLQTLAIGLMDEMTEILALCPPEADVHELPSPPVRILRCRYNRWWPGKRCQTLGEELRKQDVALLHGLEGSALEFTRCLARAGNLPYVASCYSLGEAVGLRLDEHERAVLAASKAIYDQLRVQVRTSPEHVHLVRPGVFRVGRSTCFEDPAHSAAIVVGGRLEDVAPFEAVLKAFRALRDRNYDCVFFLIGNGPAERALRKKAEDLHLLGELTFLDQMDTSQLAGIFKAADVYVSPRATGEIDFPSLLALAAGIPVLSAANRASDFLQDGQTAVFFRPGDADDLTVKLARLLDNHETAKALASHAVALLEHQHSPAAMIGQLAGIYRRAIVRETAPAAKA